MLGKHRGVTNLMPKDVYEDDDGRAAPSNTEVFTMFHQHDEKGVQSLRDQYDCDIL
jgi:hypothetical protein